MTNLTKGDSIIKIKRELSRIDASSKKNRTGRFVISALSSIPWIGGVIAASTTLHSEKEQGKINDLQKIWLNEHGKKIEELAYAINYIAEKLEGTGVEMNERLESEDYQNLVKKGFKEWDNAETIEKREYIRNLLTNAGVNSITTDDLIRLFIDWISMYHETHFMVIKEIYKNRYITRRQIWSNLNPIIPREDSVEADLYKLLIRDLSTGGIIRQYREKDYSGNFVKKPTRRSKSGVYKSAFDSVEQYELTELGKQFVHYTMNEVVMKIGN